ncbi:MAG: AAA family ATPase [Candidatus Zixiibacteriota bacterium]
MTSIDAIIDRQISKWDADRKTSVKGEQRHPQPVPVVTVSGQSGSRGSYFASRLAQKLDFQRLKREVVNEISRSADYRMRIVDLLDEQFRNKLDDLASSALTGSPAGHSDDEYNLARIVLSIAHLGGIVLMGRGGSFIIGSQGGFHIRFVAPRERRIDNLVKYCEMSRAEAEDTVLKSDISRREFISKLFDANIDDPHHYDLVINSDYMDVEDILLLSTKAIEAKKNKLTYLDHDD